MSLKITRKKLMEWVVVIILVYLGSLVYLYFNQANMIFFPDINRPAVVEDVDIVAVKTSDGLELEGWFLPPADETRPVVVLFHGNGGNFSHRIWKALAIAQGGYGVLLTEYRGYGGNPGQVGEQGFYLDARAWMNFATKRKNPVVIYGESIGTGVATLMATEYPVAGLILESPYTSVAEVAQSIYRIVPVKILLKHRFSSIDIIAKVKVPKLFIHGERDGTIPIRFGRKLFDAAAEPKIFAAIESAGHNDLYDHGAALHVLRFLSTIGASRSGEPKE